MLGGMGLNDSSGAVVDAAIKVHTALGPGLLEGAYEGCLVHELRKRGHLVVQQLALPVLYDGICIDLGYRIDLLVDGAVVVEVKSIGKLAPIHNAQLLSYLKLGGYKIGLLLNFNVPQLKDGIRRIVNRL
jgi:GxxExxY protein